MCDKYRKMQKEILLSQQTGPKVVETQKKDTKS